jgi:septal ring factor EnvC (AmiA/AmiB activator)
MRNRLYSPKNFFFSVLTIFVFITAISHSAQADEMSKYQKTLEQWSQKLPDLTKTDTGETAKDIALIQTWIGQAQAFVANENFKRIDPILLRIEAMAKYVSIKQKRVQLDTALKNAETTLNDLNQAIVQTKAEADALNKQVQTVGKSK